MIKYCKNKISTNSHFFITNWSFLPTFIFIYFIFVAIMIILRYNSYYPDTTGMKDEDLIALIIFGIILIFIMLFLRNFWNWIQKRRYKSKYNNILKENQRISEEYTLLSQNKDLLFSDIDKLKSEIAEHKNIKIQFQQTFKEKEIEIEKERKKERKKHEDELERFHYERNFYKETIKHNEVQANNTRLGAHFLKNVLFKIQQDYKKQKLSTFSLFGQNVVIEKKDKKEFLPIDILTKLNALLDYNVSTLKKRKINLNEEVIHVKTFIDIIQYLNPKLEITTNFKKNYTNIEISPTLFFPFLENVLKHGDLNSDNKFLNIELINIKNTLSYKVTNSTFNINNKKNEQGFGLESLEKALESYYKNHELDLRQEGNTFISELTVEL